MDFSDSTRVVFSRIRELEPELVTKIIGYLLLQDNGDREMIRLAFGPDNLIHSLVNKAKTELGLSKPSPSSPSQANQQPLSDHPLHFTSYTPASARAAFPPPTLITPNHYWDHQLSAADLQPLYPDSVAEDFHLQNQLQLLRLEDSLESASSVSADHVSNYYYTEPALGLRQSRRSPSLPEFPVKICHYFNKGFCKHGSNCKYYHGHHSPDSFPHHHVFSDFSNDDHAISPGSLEKLEMEITELLRSRRGCPVSIASLPMMYYEKYGRSLQAEGYLTESQRHGKTGYSLTKLLARLKNSIRLLDRPHGQHSVILAEDAPRYLEHGGDKNEPGGIVSGSRQIYLTFPAESTFTEQDVSNYFCKYGPVQDVRIPCQQKRMFGFVTFVYQETVKEILGKGNPHFVCGARVLVKPYREKSRLVDRKEKMLHPMCCNSNFVDRESDLPLLPRVYDDSSFFRKPSMSDNEQAFEVDRRCFSEMNYAAKSLSNHSIYSYSMDELKIPDAGAEQAEFPTVEGFSYFFDALNNSSNIEETRLGHIRTNYSDHQDSQGVNLPESPFAQAIGSSISTVT
ncbi:zinc finger CCCH domain-containing protein 18 [Humulus lupulus]|uniref:zinc finger CCCH domain-containing protein 18 n=1 Tax=Humulus lupulus TaxID=3486 RepID=UPI002B413710|nr:zinc finger CCCH domain-containing protein 18 [Humulus lupulus]